MPWAAAAAVVGAGLSSYSSNKASKRQQSAELAGIESQERMFEKQLELLAPYREAGYGALGGLQQLVSPEGRATMLSDYYNSDEFRQMQRQGSENAARLGAVTGGLRSGSTYMALENVAPQLGQSYLTNQYNQLTGLANLGTGAASQGAQAAGQLGQSQAIAQQNMGQAYASNQLAQANIYGNLLSDLGGMYQAGMFGS